jgi:hypothetical protein
MKKAIQLSVFILLYMLFCAKSCDNEEQFTEARQQQLIKNEKDSIRKAFGSDTLSVAALYAFEETAKLRFTDFLDYLSVLTEKNTAPEFMTHARQMTRSLFRSEDLVFRFNLPDGSGKKVITLKEFTGEGSAPPENISTIQPDSIFLVQHLKPVSDTVFAGRLGFLSRNVLTRTELKKYHLSGRTMDFYAVRREKSFGKDTLMVWTVFLGENLE